MKGRIWVCVLLSFSLVGCGSPLRTGRAPARLWDESGQELQSLPLVPRLHLEGLVQVSSNDLWVVEGEVSSVSQSRIERRDPPQTVIAHRVPTAVWNEGADRIIAPSVLLEPDTSYSLVALGVGLVAQFKTSQETPEVLRLFGPPATVPGRTLVYCPGEPPTFSAQGMSTFENLESTLPEGVSFGLDRKGWGTPCMTFQTGSGKRQFFVPPPAAGGYLVDPLPVTWLDPERETRSIAGVDEPSELSEPGEPKNAACFDRGCLEVEGAALRLQAQKGLYALSISGSPKRLFVVEHDADRPFRFGPLAPESDYEIELLFLSGETEARKRLRLKSGPAHPHLVLTEAMCDARGPEPQSEWVEIANIGSGVAHLGGLFLADDTGSVPLPALELPEGARGLIVRSDFQASVEALPAATALRVEVPSLGYNGLRNSGEAVSLLDERAHVLSSMPALSAPEGTSVARIDLWGGDAAENFALHGAPGSSPGSENTFE